MRPCPRCGRRLGSPGALRQHLRDSHPGYYYSRIALPLVALALAVGVGAALAQPLLSSFSASTAAEEGERLLNTLLTGHESLAMHIHVRLRIIVDGAEVRVPAGIGVLPDGRMRVIHTHDETGVIHVESPKYMEFTFGDFLKIWGKSLNSTCFDDLCGEVWLSANGGYVADPHSYVLRDGDELVLTVFTR
jgi:hypothetical protein